MMVQCGGYDEMYGIGCISIGSISMDSISMVVLYMTVSMWY